MKLIDMQGRVYDVKTAQDVVKQLQEAELDGWTYEAEIRNGWARIRVTDNEGNCVGYY